MKIVKTLKSFDRATLEIEDFVRVEPSSDTMSVESSLMYASDSLESKENKESPLKKSVRGSFSTDKGKLN